MKVEDYPIRSCFRVQVPAALNGGKRQSFYFKTRSEAYEFIARRTGQPASTTPVTIPQSDKVFLEDVICTVGSKSEVWNAINYYKKNVLSVRKTGTIWDMCEAFIDWQKNQPLSRSHINDCRSRAKAFARAFPKLKPTELSPTLIMAWVDSCPIKNRPNMFKVVHRLMHWAQDNEWVGVDMMKGLEKPKSRSAKDIVPIGDFERILRVCSGLDQLPDLPAKFKPRRGRRIITDFSPVLPVYVLGGLAGLRLGELVANYAEDQTVQWEDVNWSKKWIKVRHGVAKKTRRDSDLRHPRLCDAAIAWLQPIAKTNGPIVELAGALYREYRRQLCARLAIHIPTNGLRNSFASYGQSFRTLGDVAKDLGDLDETARQHYVLELEPESGRAWFDIRPDEPARILQMTG